MRSDVSNTALILSLLEDTVDINTLEEACLAFARELFMVVLQTLDDELLKHRAEGLVCVGKRSRTILTKIGEIRITRRLYRKATNGKKARCRFLLDEALKIQPRRRVTHGLLRLMVSLSTRLSFRESAEVLEEAGFPRVSHATVHAEVRRYGELVKKRLENQRRLVFEFGQELSSLTGKKKVPFLILEVDGLLVGLQGGHGRKQEIKLGVAYEGWEIQGKQRKLQNATVMMGAFENGDDFWESFSACLSERYDFSVIQVIVNGDGARWIQEQAGVYFKGCIVQLDRFHLMRDLRLLFRNKAKELMSVLETGDIQVFMDTLESLEPEVPEKKRKLFNKLLRQCRKYPSHLVDYRSRLREEQRQGYFFSGLGVAETMVDKKLANRMKKRGMRWSREGAWCMALLLMLRANGQLHQWLEETSHEDIQNPVKEATIRKRIASRTLLQDPTWRHVCIPSLNGPTRPWKIALRALAGLAST
jgi:hypothetical protein